MNKKILSVLVLLFLCSSVAMALDPMGPATSELKQGEKAVGVDYSWSQMNVDVDLGSSDNLNDNLELNGIHKIYARMVWGISDDFEAFARVGGAGMENSFDLVDPPSVGSRKGGTDWGLAWGAGIKATLYKCSEELKWGLLAQYGWTNVEGDLKGKGSFAGRFKNYEIQLQEFQFAFGPTWKMSDAVELYGGGLLHFIDGDYQVSNTSNDRRSNPFEQRNQYGAYVGGQFEVGSGKLYVEYGTTGGGTNGVGIGMMWKL